MERIGLSISFRVVIAVKENGIILYSPLCFPICSAGYIKIAESLDMKSVNKMNGLGFTPLIIGRLRKNIRRLTNILTARLAGKWTGLADGMVASYSPWVTDDVPWTPLKKKLADSTIALVTTAGVHHKSQKPFEMNDPQGDPSYRILDPVTIGSNYTITHDYYDHRDAERDINIVLPVDRLKQMSAAGFIAGISKRCFSFMGHITGRHIPELIENSAPRIAGMLLQDHTDAVLLTPG